MNTALPADDRHRHFGAGQTETILTLQPGPHTLQLLLGDQNHTISNNFGILREGVGLADRGTFVTDPDGTIQLVEITPEGVGRNAAELLRKIKAAKYWRENPGQVCPAKWEEGAATLAPSIDLVGKI